MRTYFYLVLPPSLITTDAITGYRCYLKIDGKLLPLSAGKIRGMNISFSLLPYNFSARLKLSNIPLIINLQLFK
jgi:hypothetical protein